MVYRSGSPAGSHCVSASVETLARTSASLQWSSYWQVVDCHIFCMCILVSTVKITAWDLFLFKFIVHVIDSFFHRHIVMDIWNQMKRVLVGEIFFFKFVTSNYPSLLKYVFSLTFLLDVCGKKKEFLIIRTTCKMFSIFILITFICYSIFQLIIYIFL